MDMIWIFGSFRVQEAASNSVETNKMSRHITTHMSRHITTSNPSLPTQTAKPKHKQFALITKLRDGINTQTTLHTYIHDIHKRIWKKSVALSRALACETVIVLGKCDYLRVNLWRQTPPSYYIRIIPKLISWPANHLPRMP